MPSIRIRKKSITRRDQVMPELVLTAWSQAKPEQPITNLCEILYVQYNDLKVKRDGFETKNFRVLFCFVGCFVS